MSGLNMLWSASELDSGASPRWSRCLLIALLTAISLNAHARLSRAAENLAHAQAIATDEENVSSASTSGGSAELVFADDRLAQRPPAPLSPTTQPQRPAAPAAPPPRTTPQAAPSSDFALEGATRSLGSASAPVSSTPYMIGDFFSSAGQIFVCQPQFSAADSSLAGMNHQYNQVGKLSCVLVGTIPNAGGTRRVKISENNSPIPRDRVFFDFNEFNNAALLVQQNQPNLIDVQRYTPGFEKTFWGGQASVEFRSPVAYTQNPHVFVDGTGAPKQTQFGNVSLVLKFLLWREDNFALAVGTGVNLPTGPDVQIYQFDQQFLTLKNQSVHMLPYIGAYWAPTDRSYVQSFLQIDVDTNGNAVNAANRGTAGRLNEQTFLYADVAMGYWLYRDDKAYRLTGIIPTLELHYTTTLQNADTVVVSNNISQQFTLGNSFNRLDILNATAGTHFRLGKLSFLTLAGVFPLKTQASDRQFDSEIVAQFNRLF